ncbi:similar to Saccharomyces cerevisiae YJL127C SPT10 Putative histone acetylase with a role in transcriptional silencing [Maudiozyma barnettii]|uniref:Similar to Saccharomyces cerevisiae YJL127C SPT10 Putative histone acetylase with a role in transcriptional silencing n=1 Tax=Maudiozyma barnettii TaxID=61262 RepID=A0A8H2VDG4_9SACH|nr:uncharacterized protein KABA2_02S14850 [Kazachstania barnettii]CAB4253238.1 similar to Saccharomyces cerevisiae YJL127C SPT10 Putative histone acetylase with a role in transcriptional silencing [Kazachstania barnettii]CAD1780226.1 similar to Saccharomyces cerevisiae YJL127C SPT10 Putative histone acetylase with a role in transcriptional silencing [Kazachstania barnettii]
MTKEEINYSTSNLHDGPSYFKPLVDKIEPFQCKLKNSDTIATAFPVFHHSQIPNSLVEFLQDAFNKEIERGDTYPQDKPLSKDEFLEYWFHSFTVIFLETDKLIIPGNITKSEDWSKLVLGTFYIKPNYMPRCSQNCNAGFLVNYNHRSKRIGHRLGQIYLKWAPLLGYKYSVYNLVFVTNVASTRIWDHLKFDRIGLVPKAGILKGHDEPIDAIIFGKDLTNIEPELFDDLVQV